MGILPPYIERAFAHAPRENFLPENIREQAEWDMPLPIGFGQTNSQPSTVALMLYWLNPAEGSHVLDVGSGSGWTAALLASLVGPKGRVDAVEKVPELVDFGRQNCAAIGTRNVTFHQAGTTLGWPANAPYDYILVSAAATKLPDVLMAQLAIGGTLVMPIQHDVVVIQKLTAETYDTTTHPGFSFVPLL